MNKKIEEMANKICHLGLFCFECSKRGKCKAYKYAARAYNAGYRKKSDAMMEAAAEIFAELNLLWHKGRGFIDYSDLLNLEILYEQQCAREEGEKDG